MKDNLTFLKKSQYGFDCIDIIGNITNENVDGLERFLADNLTAQSGNVILNMEGVKYIPVSVLGNLEKIFQDIDLKKIHIFIMNIRDDIKPMFATSRIKRYFRIIENENMLRDRLKKQDFEDLLDPLSE